MGHSKRRGHPLRRWAIPGTGLGGPPKRRRSLARTEQEPEVEAYADEHDAYDWQSVQRRYSDWGCVAPPPPSSNRRD